MAEDKRFLTDRLKDNAKIMRTAKEAVRRQGLIQALGDTDSPTPQIQSGQSPTFAPRIAPQ